MIPQASTSSLVIRRLNQKRKKKILDRLSWQVLKTHARNNFFSLITAISILAILGLSLLANWQYSLNNLKEEQANLLTSFTSLMEADPEQIEEKLRTIEAEILSDFNPVLRFMGVESAVRADFQQMRELTRDWLLATKTLRQYKVSAEGFVNPLQPSATFTDDLAKFLPALQSDFLPRTKQTWQDLQTYLNLAKLSGNQQITDLEKLLSAVIDLGQVLSDNGETILAALGHERKQKIVIFNQNIGEARPTGGFPGSYISLDLFKGRLHINESNSIYHPDKSIEQKLYMHPSTTYYSWFASGGTNNDHGIRNANYLPCFPETAQIVYEGFSMSPHGYEIDQIIFITPQLLLDILGTDFTFEVPGVGELNSSNIMDEIERVTALEYEDKSNPKKKIKDILETLLKKIPQIIQQKSSVDWLQLALRALSARDLQIWSSQEAIQKLYIQTGLANLSLCNLSDIPEIGFLSANISSDKRGLVTENQFNIHAQDTSQGTKFYVKYKQLLPPDPQLQRGFKQNRSFTFVGLQLPPEAQNLNVSSPQAIYVPFTKTYYQELFERRHNENLTFLPQIAYIIRTGRNLYSPQGNPPGFAYDHLNGSQVVGIYIHDSQEVAEVEFSFTLLADKKVVQFYGQPGLRETSLGLGEGLEFYDKPDQKSLRNYYQIPAGVYLRAL